MPALVEPNPGFNDELPVLGDNSCRMPRGPELRLRS
jgi:hypothetical protein